MKNLFKKQIKNFNNSYGMSFNEFLYKLLLSGAIGLIIMSIMLHG